MILLLRLEDHPRYKPGFDMGASVGRIAEIPLLNLNKGFYLRGIEEAACTADKADNREHKSSFIYKGEDASGQEGLSFLLSQSSEQGSVSIPNDVAILEGYRRGYISDNGLIAFLRENELNELECHFSQRSPSFLSDMIHSESGVEGYRKGLEGKGAGMISRRYLRNESLYKPIQLLEDEDMYSIEHQTKAVKVFIEKEKELHFKSWQLGLAIYIAKNYRILLTPEEIPKDSASYEALLKEMSLTIDLTHIFDELCKEPFDSRREK